MMDDYTLLEKCNTFEAEYSDSFVGIHFHDGIFDIKFPLGFDYIELEDYKGTKDFDKASKQYRKDILKLISILHFYKNKDKTRNAKDEQLKDSKNNFPLYAYLYVFNWYRNNGYYKPKEIIYQKGSKGKINWNRTIKNIDPVVNKKNIVYLDFIVKKDSYNEDEILAKLNRFCVYESFLKVGCLFTPKAPRKEKIKGNHKYYSHILSEKIASTFIDSERELFINMKKILDIECNKISDNEYFYGTEFFNNIWESMIDEVYGIDKNRAEFLRPHIQWLLPNNEERKVTLKPDTIMIPKT